jgi:hypothetical protein
MEFLLDKETVYYFLMSTFIISLNLFNSFLVGVWLFVEIIPSIAASNNN